MPVIARISSIWSKQKLFVAIFFVAVSCWFYLDGAIRYLKSNVRFDAHKALEDSGREKEWPEYAKAHGWVVDPPHKRFSAGEITVQFVFGGIGTAVGVLLFIYWLTQRKRSLKIEDGAVFTPSGVRV